MAKENYRILDERDEEKQKQENLNFKKNILTIKGDIKNINARLVNVNNKISNSNTVIQDVNKEIFIIENRINNLTKMEEGSTTGDAELIDIRAGADGITYPTAGEAVRTQFENVNKGLNQLYPYNLDDELFTLGTYGLSEDADEFIYRNSDVRVCTAKGFEVPLNEGDVITVKKPVTCFRVGYKDSETGELTITDLQYGQYTVPVTSDYIFILARIENNTDVVVTDPKELSRCLFIESSNRLANYCKWLKLNKIENKLEDQTAFVFDDECFIYGSIGTTADNEYKYDTTHKSRVCTAKGLEIPLNKGDIIRIEEPLTRFNMTYKDSETSEIIWLGWQYGEYTVPVTANYVFVLSKIENDTEVTANETKEFSRALSIITDKNSRLENYQKDWKLANTHEYTVLDDEIFTLGTIGLSEDADEFIHRNSNVRVCTAKGFEVPLNEGDIVTVEKPVTCYRICYKDTETGELIISDLIYGKYTIPATNNYAFVLARIENNADVVVNESKELSRCLLIETSNRLNDYFKWSKINESANKLEDKTAFAFDDECFIYGSIGGGGTDSYVYNTSYKERVCTAKGFEVPLNEGDIIKIEAPLTRFNMAYKDAETGKVMVTGWMTHDYKVPITTSYVFVLSRVENDTEIVANEPKEFSRALSIITDKNSRLENYQKDWKLANTHEYTVIDDEVFTLGTIGLSENNDEFIYRDSDIRVCTPKGFEVPLNEGDVITIKKPITCYRICYKDTETGELIISDMKYGKYTIPATNNYAFILARIENNADVVVTDPKELSRCLLIETSNRLNNYFKWSKINEVAGGVTEGDTEEDEFIKNVADKTHQAIDGNNLVFVHFTDTHCGTWPMTLKMTKKHMDKAVKLAETVNADFLIHTGDIIQGDGSSTGSYGSDDKERYKTIVDSLCGSTVPFIWCQGNSCHDCGVPTDDGYALTKQQVTSYMGRFGRGLIAKAVYNDNDKIKTYFYYDMPLQNCRIIVTDSSDFGEQRLANGWSDIQITWLRSVLSDAQEKELAVILFSHMPPHSGLTPSCPSSASNVQSAVEDFITDGGNFIACIHGHVHLDNYYYDENTGMAFITIASSWPSPQDELPIYGNISIPERTIGTISEYAYDVYVVNTETRKTQIFRYGAGIDRKFSY